MTENKIHPESHMMSYGYDPSLSQGSLKTPIFQTSTFIFNTAEEGKKFFEMQKDPNCIEKTGLIYSRLNNPNLEIVENRLALYEKGAEDAALFESGMAAISTLLLEYLRPGDLLLYSNPLYGGTDSFINNILTRYGIHILGFKPNDTEASIISLVEKSGLKDKLRMIYVETPANPNNTLIDIDMCVAVGKYFSTPEKKIYVTCDNTYMGPIWQHPLAIGADFTLYSATKYLGGHSDIIAGVCMGSKLEISRIKKMRTNLGGMSGPHTAWLLSRSLETLNLRMEKQCANAQFLAKYLRNHSKISKVYYLDIFEDERQAAIYKKQNSAQGAMISFDIIGGESACFKFLNKLKLIKLAVSLGSTESLMQHPYTMTHSSVAEETKKEFNITPNLIRFSVGVEHPDDLIADIEQALL